MSVPGAAPDTGSTESAFKVHAGTTTLAGTLLLPGQAAAGQVPVVLIVAGSGPTDRNGDSPGGVRGEVYAQVAGGLAEHGIASLRYDKRGIGATPLGVNPSDLSIDLYAADVRAAADSLRSDGRFSRVILLGHSEGAGLVLQAVNRGAPANGIIMLAGAGRPILEVVHSQLAVQLDSAALLSYDSAMARFTRGEPSGIVPPATVPLFMPYLRNFMRSWAAYDPAAELRRAMVPVLLVSAERDIQATAVEHARLVSARPSASVLLLPGASHVLKPVASTDRETQIAVYADPTLSIVPQLVPGLVSWIRTLR
ncbi:MAG: alpha/beta fold hydrolase [Gemmatimonadales bacterium]|nr:alpha/beta fold hydrolase [Gemmatimonadales bacterium]